ncbi:EF-hand domain-containing protein [Shewanella gelidii]|uniref:EF-hand domain-containing protein n=1 Tax=Shewanella gelidii TaxID=1642821 RepID=A0A917JME9_9GAMM|nr:EF-hand domain-containing protein [Shewanella gelidii]MCL1097183.1 EF-hand domain-containing protein [Shewanella gelidii]GGI73101.1 hypothetical protein GCM10009332_08290 [Shewanella gelidii]
MNNQKFFIISCFFPLLGLSLYVQAETETQPKDIDATGPIPFSQFDANQDGFISAKEYKQTRTERLQKQQKDGKPNLGAKTSPSFEEIDSNHDQKISRQELATVQRERQMETMLPLVQQTKKPMMRRNKRPDFSEFDLNHDGQLTQQELTEARQLRRQANQKNGQGRNQKQPRTRFAEIDIDKNGTVSPEEFKQHQMNTKRNYD